jgi:hypothetical protein
MVSSAALDLRRMFAREQQGELLTALAGRETRSLAVPSQNAGDEAQHLIARSGGPRCR